MNRIVLVGMKSSGKTTTGRILASRLRASFVDMDSLVEDEHARSKGERLAFREIFKLYGGDYFRALETATLRAFSAASKSGPFVLATGGGLPLAEENRTILKELGTIVFLDAPQDQLLKRILAGGVPAFFPYPGEPERSLTELLAKRRPVYGDIADIVVDCGSLSPYYIAQEIVRLAEKRAHEH